MDDPDRRDRQEQPSDGDPAAGAGRRPERPRRRHAVGPRDALPAPTAASGACRAPATRADRRVSDAVTSSSDARVALRASPEAAAATSAAPPRDHRCPAESGRDADAPPIRSPGDRSGTTGESSEPPVVRRVAAVASVAAEPLLPLPLLPPWLPPWLLPCCRPVAAWLPPRSAATPTVLSAPPRSTLRARRGARARRSGRPSASATATAGWCSSGRVITLVSRVTAPLRARSRPSTVAPVFGVDRGERHDGADEGRVGAEGRCCCRPARRRCTATAPLMRARCCWRR